MGESAEMWQGKPARLLTFELPLTGVGPKERKMIKEFKATAKVWVDAEGLPLAAHTKVSLKGRALMVISFSQEVEESFTFGRAGNRLLCLSQETEQRGSGGGEKGHSRVIRTFRVQS